VSDLTSLPVQHLFTLIVHVTSVAGTISDGPTGTRVVFDAASGTFSGSRLRGTVRGPGGDWATIRANGTGQLDVRLLLVTDDGATIFMTYAGIATEGAAHIRTAPLFQTGDERYAWLNDVQAVATGSASEDSVTYDVYQLL